MFLQVWRVLTLLLAALSMGLTFTHVLELPAKMNYDARFYATVNSTLYGGFGTVGAAVEVGGVLAATVLTILLRRQRRAFRWSLAGTILLWASLASWWVIVYPVNATVRHAWPPDEPLTARTLRSPPEPVVQTWTQLRNRWEYGHATGFALHLPGFIALATSLVVKEAVGCKPSGS